MLPSSINPHDINWIKMGFWLAKLSYISNKIVTTVKMQYGWSKWEHMLLWYLTVNHYRVVLLSCTPVLLGDTSLDRCIGKYRNAICFRFIVTKVNNKDLTGSSLDIRTQAFVRYNSALSGLINCLMRGDGPPYPQFLWASLTPLWPRRP